jgi:glycosyltransferase involved in cell wall biosynthesis
MAYLSGGGLSGGARTTLRRLILAMHKLEGVEAIRLFVPPASLSLPELSDLQPETWPAGEHWRGFPTVRKQLDEWGADVLFVPSAVCLKTDRPVVVMVRNTEPILNPIGSNPLRVGLKNLVRRLIARRSCRRATRVIAVSSLVRELIQTRWQIPADKIGVVYHGVGEPLEASGVCRPERIPFDDDRPFWFAAGSLLPYRGLEDLIDAMATRAKTTSVAPLLIAGASVYSDRYRQRIARSADRAGLGDCVHWLGQLDRAELGWCYRNCHGMVVTSRLEACPNVALEAMSYGCVTISTDCPPMPEMFGEAALYYPAGQGAKLAERMAQVSAMTAAERESLSDRATERAKQFRWSQTARATLAQLQLACEHWQVG